jgi:VCBS repeat protein
MERRFQRPGWPCVSLLLTAGLLATGGAASGQGLTVPSKPGFPATFAGGGTIRQGHPAIADLGLTPGHRSIVFGTSTRRLYVVLWNGALAPGFPVTLPAEIASSPGVGDLTGDGIPEIVVGYGSLFAPGNPGGVRAYRRDGTLLWDRPSIDITQDGIPEQVLSAPAIGDVDGDGSTEVAWGSLDARVYVVTGSTGANEPGWPRSVRDTVFSSPTLADVDGDGKVDVVIGTDSHKEQSPYNTADGGCLHVFRFDGNEVVGFPRCVDQTIGSAPAFGDIDGDGRPEIVVGTGIFWPNRAHRVYAFECDGTPTPGWPVAVDGQVGTAPALGDLDGDGVPEVVVTDDDSGPAGVHAVYAFRGNGTRIFRTVPKDFWGGTLSAGDPVIADVLGDAGVEILLPTNGEVCVISAIGTQLTHHTAWTPSSLPSFTTDFSLFHAAVADFESDGGSVEIVAVSGTPFPAATDVKVWVWNPKATGAIPWGLFRQNERRTGILPNTPPCPNSYSPTRFYTLPPCRVLDTRAAAGPYGGPVIPAQNIRTFLLAGRCGIPADARAVSANVTVVQPFMDGNLRLFPGAGPSPPTSIINYRGGQVRANNLLLRLGAGEISIQNDQGSGTTNVLLDVNGYFK